MELYRSKRLTIDTETVALPDGTKKDRVVVRPADAVAMLPLEGEHCYLIRQYRYAIDDYILEVPAGAMDAGETPQETARRELIEEIGRTAETFIPQGFIYTTPGFTTERIFLFEARGLSASCEFCKDDDEDIEVIPVKTGDLREMILNGKISDAKTICLIYRCLG
jgi:ADP-ribose pyrophosphatase